MVEYAINLDSVFASLADATRRDILKRVMEKPCSISELAKPYNVSFAAVAKQVAVLEAALLVFKRREGKQQIISANPKAIDTASEALKQYQEMWNKRFDALEELLEKE